MLRDTLVPIVLFALWAAFALVCVGLWFSSGRGPLLLAKLRLGGLILCFGPAALSSSCETEPTCYFCPGCDEEDTGDTGDREEDDGPRLHPCRDHLDNDGDTWIDEEDPDCLTGYDEVGHGTTACNDGVDNDKDGWIDSHDRHCDDASDDDESGPET